MNPFQPFQNVKTMMVEIQVAAGDPKTVFKFDNQNFLRNKQIVSIEVFTVTDMTAAPSGNTLPTTANAKTAYLTLYGENPDPDLDKNGNPVYADGTWMEQIPFWSMHRIDNGTEPYVKDLYTMMPRTIMWEKSFFTTDAALGNSAVLSWCVLVGYMGNVD